MMRSKTSWLMPQLKMHALADDDGYSMQIVDAIVDYRKDINTVDKSDICLLTKSG